MPEDLVAQIFYTIYYSSRGFEHFLTNFFNSVLLIDVGNIAPDNLSIIGLILLFYLKCCQKLLLNL